MAGRRVDVVLTQTNDVDVLSTGLNDININGEADLVTAIKVAMLSLRHR